jgi:hypothetical protein
MTILLLLQVTLQPLVGFGLLYDFVPPVNDMTINGAKKFGRNTSWSCHALSWHVPGDTFKNTSRNNKNLSVGKQF